MCYALEYVLTADLSWRVVATAHGICMPLQQLSHVPAPEALSHMSTYFEVNSPTVAASRPIRVI